MSKITVINSLFILGLLKSTLAQSAGGGGAVEYIDCISAVYGGGKTPSTSVLDMTLNSLMVRSQ